MKLPLYKQIARAVVAYNNCLDQDEQPIWQETWLERLYTEIPKHLPSGGGFDAGTVLDLDISKPDKLVFTTSFHHMDVNGVYSGWTYHQVIITPNLGHDFEIKVTGRDRNDIKDFITDSFSSTLRAEMDWAAQP